MHEFIDEQRRRELTRERVPIRGKELGPLLLECIRDRSGALAASLHRLEYRGELQSVKVEGERARGKLIDKTKPARWKANPNYNPQEQKIGFVKDGQGWRIDLDARFPNEDSPLPEREVDEATKKINALVPRPTKPWTGKAPPRYETPEQMDASQKAGFDENDPEKIWHCLTERNRNSFMKEGLLMLIDSGGGDEMIAWYSDNAKFKDKVDVHRRLPDLSGDGHRPCP